MSVYDSILANVLNYIKNSGSQQSILPFIPKPIKWGLLLLLIANGRNFPFVWTFRLMRYAGYAIGYHWFLKPLGFDHKAQKQLRETRDSTSDANAFSIRTVYSSKAAISACDYNFHLSNTSYAVALDILRTKFFMNYLPSFQADGGKIIIAGICLNFIKEIPMNAKFDVITTIASWDNKWFFLVSHFVTYSKRASKDKSTQNPSRTILGESIPQDAVLHCTAISRACFKFKRITVPPVIALACAGYQISHSTFAQVQSWRVDKGKKRIRDFYAGGWKDVLEDQRWWEEAFKDLEPERVRRLAAVRNYSGLPQTDSS